jgi:hypothetical protein
VRSSDSAISPWIDAPAYPNASINDEIITGKSATGVLVLFEHRGQEFNYVNAVTALHRLAKLAGSRHSVHQLAHFSELLDAVKVLPPAF